MLSKYKILKCIPTDMSEISLDSLSDRVQAKDLDRFQILVDELGVEHFVRPGKKDSTVRLYTCSALKRYRVRRIKRIASVLVSLIGMVAAVIAAIPVITSWISPGP